MHVSIGPFLSSSSPIRWHLAQEPSGLIVHRTCIYRSPICFRNFGPPGSGRTDHRSALAAIDSQGEEGEEAEAGDA